MINNRLIVNGNVSPDGKYVIISPEIKLIVDPHYYRERKFGELGLMPRDIEFDEDSHGIEQIVTEHLGVEQYGNLTLRSKEGEIGQADFSFVCEVKRGENNYILRHGTYKKDDLFALYLRADTPNPVLIGIGDVNFEEESVAKLLGIGINDKLQRGGHGTAFVAVIERECAKTNMFLLLHDPLRQVIPFYVSRGYRHLVHPNGLDFAKVLNPGFDERLLMPDEKI